MVHDTIEGTSSVATPPEAGRSVSETASDLVVAASVLGLFAALLAVTRGAWFYADEWAVTQRGLSPVDLVRPYNGHLSVGFLTVYRVHYGLFGFQHHVLLRIIAFGLLAALPAVLYLTTKARWGAPQAAVAAGILAWGPAPGIDSASMNHWASLLAGLVGAWALPRTGRRADALVAGSLVAAFLSAGGAVAFAAAFVGYTLVSGAKARRWAAVLGPTLAWCAWYGVAGRSQPGLSEAARLDLPGLALLPARGVAEAVEGVAFGSPVLAVVLGVGLVGLVVQQARRGRDGWATLLAYGGAAVAWWLMLGLSRGVLAGPEAPRYQVFTLTLLLLAVVPVDAAAAPARRDEGVRRWAPTAGAALVAIVLGASATSTFRERGDELRSAGQSSRRRVDLVATVGRDSPRSRPVDVWAFPGLTYGDLDDALTRYGYDRADTREELDARLVANGGVAEVRGEAPDRACTVLESPDVEADDGLALWATDGPVAVEARSYGDAWVQITDIDPGEAVTLLFARDIPGQIWQVRADGACR